MSDQIAQNTNKKSNQKREDVAYNLHNFNESQQNKHQWSEENGIPRSTLRHWLKRRNENPLPEKVISFFESKEGLSFLHKLMTSLLFVFTKVGVSSLRNVEEFLRLSDLAYFMCSSSSIIQKYSSQMDEFMNEFGEDQKKNLIPNMPKKKITLAQDETFHPEICMVSMELVSNFILLEKYVENREGKTWNEVIDNSLHGLPVEVIQVTSDEGSGLKNHILKGLGVHHSSDCFHVSYEISKGTSGALNAKIKQAEKVVKLNEKKVIKEKIKRDQFDLSPKKGRRPYFEKRIDEGVEEIEFSKKELERRLQNKKEVKEARVKITEIYHPYDLETGNKNSAANLKEEWDSCFEKIRKGSISLSENAKKRIEKAYRVIPNFVSTIVFFFFMVDLCLEEKELNLLEKKLIQDELIPYFYLKSSAMKEKDLDKKHKIQEKARELLSSIEEDKENFSTYSLKKQENFKSIAKECVNFFQRSSSCVEGRNAQLSLRHHGIHRLSHSVLQAQTVIHNYHTKNKNNKTPSTEFFEQEHDNLFESLLDKMDYSSRSRYRLDKAG
jgi:hypothetical protein